MIEEVKKQFLLTQDKIQKGLSSIDDTENFIDDWKRNDNLKGFGKTIILKNGFIEKGGVNFSFIQGNSLPNTASKTKKGQAFTATGVSIVIHPQNPHIPTSHMNIRYIQTTNDAGEQLSWFGGGYDLTPYYVNKSDCILWHKEAKQSCDKFSTDLYPKLKKQCDEYFYLPHREETRGIGGIFYDDLNIDNDKKKTLNFSLTVANSYLNSYTQIVKNNINKTFGENEKKFQHYRRGRYVEFNLLYDRGTIFGLQTKGRIESILMSMPPHATWEYNKEFLKNSPENELKQYLKAIDWVSQKR